MALTSHNSIILGYLKPLKWWIFCSSLLLSVLFVGNSYAQNKQALVIGISTYNPKNMKDDGAWANIHGANDAVLITSVLKKQGFNVVCLKDMKSTAKNIRAAFKSLIAKTKAGDIVYVHFSGHGQPVEDRNGDEEDGWDEAIVPVDAGKLYSKTGYTGGNHILDDELHNYFKALRETAGKSGMVYAVIDACHAGSSYRGEEEEDTIIVRGTDRGFSYTGKRYAPRIDKRGNLKVEQAASLSGICILEACRAYEVNTEIRDNGQYYGPLSFYVSKVLSANNLSNDYRWTGKVTGLMDKDRRLVKQHIVIETSK